MLTKCLVFCIYLSIFIPLTSFAGEEVIQDYSAQTKKGDINNDSSLSIFDLLALLKQLAAHSAYDEGADIDENGKIDIFDLLAWINLYKSLSITPEESFKLKIRIGHIILDNNDFDPQLFKDEGGNSFSVAYNIYSNKEIQDFLFVFGEDTLDGLSGRITVNAPDTTRPPYFQSEPKPWVLRARSASGEVYTQSGTSKLLFPTRYMVSISYKSFAVVGNQIDFPLVLRGPWQRFASVMRIATLYDLVIDLNPAGLDSVIFPDIDSLASAIMYQAIQNDSSRATNTTDVLLVAPAKDNLTGDKLDRLIIDTYLGTTWPLIKVLDGNESVLFNLGFPAWLRNIDKPFTNPRYSVYDGWEDWLYKYPNVHQW